MGGKGKKKRNSKDSTGSNSNGKKKAGKSKSSGSTGRTKSAKYVGDIFSEGAMENAYCVCHNIQDVLKARGFPWPDGKKKGKKGKKK